MSNVNLASVVFTVYFATNPFIPYVRIQANTHKIESQWLLNMSNSKAALSAECFHKSKPKLLQEEITRPVVTKKNCDVVRVLRDNVFILKFCLFIYA